jgi:hypothetical protein
VETQNLVPVSQMAADAKTEHNATNASHIPVVNFWGAAGLAIFVLYLQTGYRQGHGELLPWAAMCLASPMLGHMIRAATLLRRAWASYDEFANYGRVNLFRLNPNQGSKNLLMTGNIVALILPAALLVAINIYARAQHMAEMDKFILGLADGVFLFGAYAYSKAEQLKPTFTS